ESGQRGDVVAAGGRLRDAGSSECGADSVVGAAYGRDLAVGVGPAHVEAVVRAGDVAATHGQCARGAGSGAVDGDRLGAGGGGVGGGVFDHRLELVLAFADCAEVDGVGRVCGHVGTGHRLAVVAGPGVSGLLAAVDEPVGLGDPGVVVAAPARRFVAALG